jgi:hypothetical protein
LLYDRLINFTKLLSGPIQLMVVILASNPMASAHTITNYQSTFIPVQDQTRSLQIIVRLFNQQEKMYALLVNPYTLQTSLSELSQLHQRQIDGPQHQPGYFRWEEIARTPYSQLIQHSTQSGFLSENGGIKHALVKTNGVFLTVDMCPSKKEFDKAFFEKLISLSTPDHPFEVGISMSGIWLLGHPEEFAWLCQQAHCGHLNITWINHTFSHLYYPDVGLSANFMRFHPFPLPETEKQSFIQTRLQEEILLTERLLLEHGQLPSMFFRFPGLIADLGLAHHLAILGLIPIGTDAWLAKGEIPEEGSIILVHGNGNESPGIRKIMQLFGESTFEWLPLSHLAKLKN